MDIGKLKSTLGHTLAAALAMTKAEGSLIKTHYRPSRSTKRRHSAYFGFRGKSYDTVRPEVRKAWASRHEDLPCRQTTKRMRREGRL